MRRPLLAALLVLAAAAAPAQASLPPSLTSDLAFAPPTGIARSDFALGTVADIPAAVAVDGDRIYTVGRTQGGSGGQDIGIVARKRDGSFDTGFSDDGKLIISIAPGTEADIGTSIAVLPDHRIRILAATDAQAGTGENLDVAIVGLLPNGTPDTAFGALAGGGPARTGRIVFPVGSAADSPTAIVAGPGGQLAVVGTRSGGTPDDVFVSLREANGTPVTTFGTNGIKIANVGGTANSTTLIDRGVDVAFRPGGGLVALVLADTNPFTSTKDFSTVLQAFGPTGAEDPTFGTPGQNGKVAISVGQLDTIPGGLVAYGGRYYVSGYTASGADTNAFLARVNGDGSALDTRMFDMRGRVVAAGQAVVSRSTDLALVPGLPATLVAVGSVDWGTDTGASATDWAAAAFNDFEGPLAAAGYGDTVIQAPGSGGLVSVASGDDGSVAVAGTYVDSSSSDNSFGNARLLIDSEKRCDLAITVAEPSEIVFHGRGTSRLTATVTNGGSKACGGTLRVPSPYRMGPVATGVLAPGASFVARDVEIAHDGPLRPEDVLTVTVDAPGDADDSNDVAAVHVVFSYCSLRLDPAGRAGWIPTEGKRRFDVTLRNAGTTECMVRVGGRAPYGIDAGKSVTDELGVRAPVGAIPGRRVAVVLRASAAGDVDTGDDAVTRRPVVVRVGDSDIRGAGAGGFRGTARKGSAPGVKRKWLRVTHVEVAVKRVGAKCGWLRSARRGGFTSGCKETRWLRTRGRAHWRLRLAKQLPAGSYEIRSRARIRVGFAEARFSTGDRNKVAFRVG